MHRCNGRMEQARVLSRDLHTLNYKDLGSGGTVAMTLSQSISHVCFHHIAMDSCGRGRFQCADGWFDYDIIRSADDYCSGFVSGHTKSEAYQFYRERGADPVIKKLGEQPASSGKLIKQFYGIGTGQGAEGYVTNTYQISQSDKNSNYKCYILNVSTAYIDMVTWEGCEISISNGGKKISEAVYDGISVSNGSLGSVRGMRLKTFVWMLPGDAPVGSTFTIRARGIFIGQIIGIQ